MSLEIRHTLLGKICEPQLIDSYAYCLQENLFVLHVFYNALLWTLKPLTLEAEVKGLRKMCAGIFDLCCRHWQPTRQPVTQVLKKSL